MTTQRGHRQLPPDGQSRTHPASPGRPPGRPGPLPTTSHDDDQVQVDPALAQHGLRQLQRQAPTSARGRAVMDMAGDHADPGHPSGASAGPTATPRDLIPIGHSGRRNARTPGAGHWTPGRSDTCPGHRSRGQAPWTPDARTGHWTPDAGHGRGHGDDSTAGIRTSLAATPSDRTLRRATVFVLSHYQPAARPLRRPSGASAHCSPQTITGRA
jgi:hypothetical protein